MVEMKHKRLNRDGWGFQYYPYYQMRIDHELFRGLACLIRCTDGEKNFWRMPKAGRVQVTGAGTTWLELVPDGGRRVITAIYFPDGTHGAERKRYPVPADPRYQPSVWYIDVIEGTETDDCGIAVFIDKYLDVVMSPEGDVKIDDRDELDAAFTAGELTKAQYDAALAECETILREYCADIRKTDAWCAAVRRIVEDRIAEGEPVTMCREVRELRKREAARAEYRWKDGNDADFRRFYLETEAYYNRVAGGAEKRQGFVPYNLSDAIPDVVIAYAGGRAAGCAGLKAYSETDAEVKRVWVEPEYRRCGIAEEMMDRIEAKAAERGFRRTILQTRPVMKDAVGLYLKRGYRQIENYPPYDRLDGAVCYAKEL